jgi:hypothetical protein
MGSSGALFLSLAGLSACSKYEIVDCTDDQEDYIDASLAWVEAEQARLDAEAATIVTDPSLSALQIVRSLDGATIKCGVGKDGDTVPATSRNFPNKELIVDVQDPFIVNGLEMFVETRWVSEYEYEDLDDPEVVDYSVHTDPFGTAYRYTLSLGNLGIIFAHEGGHFLLGDHTRDAKKEVEELAANGQLSPADTAHIDEIYGWGYASLATAHNVYETEIETAR